MEGKHDALPVQRRFHVSRLSELYLAQAYEPLLPIVRRSLPPSQAQAGEGTGSPAIESEPCKPRYAAGG